MDNLRSGDQKTTLHLVEKQLRLWNARRMAAREKLDEEPRYRYRFLTIARDEGSLANEIAQELSRRLGWHVFDREIVAYIARNSHVRENLVSQLDEKAEGLVQDMLSGLLMPESASLGVAGYHVSLLRTLAAVAAHGSAILVGRGANFALRGNEHGLNIRITASPDMRLHRLSERWEVNPEEARRRMQADDEERREFIRQYFRNDFDDMRFYDLVYNTDRLSTDQIVDSILPVLAGPKPMPPSRFSPG
jgi:hypothetical protein